MKHFMYCQSNSSMYRNSIVFGGRTNNERYKEYSYDYVCDPDMSSCYASALRSLIYPLGVPTYYANTPNERSLTLKDFLKKNENSLVDGLYTIVVSGTLSFEQDLIASRIITDSKNAFFSKPFFKAKELYEEDHIAGRTIIARQEILNGIITADILNILRKVSTNKELAEFYMLKVESAVFYKKEDMVESYDDWIDIILENEGTVSEISYDMKLQGFTDTRSRKWHPVKLEDFMGKITDKRKYYKDLSKDKSVDQNISAEASAKSDVLKLVANGFYGVTASRFFYLNNTVVANNITAKARVGIWMMCKSLNLIQSITDGGLFELKNVYFIKTGYKKIIKPGMHTLADTYRLRESRYVKEGSLGDIDWKNEFENFNPENQNIKNIEALIKNHIDNFWSVYNLKFMFNIEVKAENF